MQWKHHRSAEYANNICKYIILLDVAFCCCHWLPSKWLGAQKREMSARDKKNSILPSLGHPAYNGTRDERKKCTTRRQKQAIQSDRNEAENNWDFSIFTILIFFYLNAFGQRCVAVVRHTLNVGYTCTPSHGQAQAWNEHVRFAACFSFIIEIILLRVFRWWGPMGGLHVFFVCLRRSAGLQLSNDTRYFWLFWFAADRFARPRLPAMYAPENQLSWLWQMLVPRYFGPENVSNLHGKHQQRPVFDDSRRPFASA